MLKCWIPLSVGNTIACDGWDHHQHRQLSTFLFLVEPAYPVFFLFFNYGVVSLLDSSNSVSRVPWLWNLVIVVIVFALYIQFTPLFYTGISEVGNNFVKRHYIHHGEKFK